jgi:hypothetical protein
MTINRSHGTGGVTVMHYVVGGDVLLGASCTRRQIHHVAVKTMNLIRRTYTAVFSIVSDTVAPCEVRFCSCFSHM